MFCFSKRLLILNKNCRCNLPIVQTYTFRTYFRTHSRSYKSILSHPDKRHRRSRPSGNGQSAQNEWSINPEMNVHNACTHIFIRQYETQNFKHRQAQSGNWLDMWAGAHARSPERQSGQVRKLLHRGLSVIVPLIFEYPIALLYTILNTTGYHEVPRSKVQRTWSRPPPPTIAVLWLHPKGNSSQIVTIAPTVCRVRMISCYDRLVVVLKLFFSSSFLNFRQNLHAHHP